jgi:hypothetical protein
MEGDETMSREDIVAIGSRLLAVYLAITVLQTVMVLVPAFFTEDGVPLLWRVGIAASVLAMLGICALLWWFPLTIARKLLPVMREPRSEESIGAGTAMSLALTILGVWLFVTGLVRAAYLAMLVYEMSRAEIPLELAPRQYADIAAAAANLVIGAWLVLGNAGIRRLVARLQYAGSPTQ